jgi:hypothetical protein
MLSSWCVGGVHVTYSSIRMRYHLADYGVYCTNAIVDIDDVTKMDLIWDKFRALVCLS